MMLLAVETQVSDWCVSIIIGVISVVVLLVKFVGGYSLTFVCSVNKLFATYKQTVSLWLRYINDTFTAVHKDKIDTFHKHLNRQNADIQFTREVEENGKIPFLDCLVS